MIQPFRNSNNAVGMAPCTVDSMLTELVKAILEDRARTHVEQIGVVGQMSWAVQPKADFRPASVSAVHVHTGLRIRFTAYTKSLRTTGLSEWKARFDRRFAVIKTMVRTVFAISSSTSNILSIGNF